MSGPFVIYNTAQKRYLLPSRKHKWTDDINMARTFRRRCDASNALRGLMPDQRPFCEVVEEVRPATYVPVGTKEPDIKLYKLVPTRPEIHSLPPPAGGYRFHTENEACYFRTHLASKMGLHADYIKVVQVGESNSFIRPDWQNYFLGLAYIVSRRSHDAQTQHGCIITDCSNRILGTGYNGFPRGMKDNTLPRTRPEKYAWMIHSEVNAVSNCILKPDGATAYVTGEPCNNCLMHMWQNGIVKVVHIDRYGSQLITEETRKVFNTFVEQTGIKIEKVKPDFKWIESLAADIGKLLK